MTALPLRSSQARTARVRAALARMTTGAVFELPKVDIRERFMSPTKVIAWRRGTDIELRTWDESKTKGAPRWSIDAEGRLLDNDLPTMWTIGDLRPTGENVLEEILNELPEEDDDAVPAQIISLRPNRS